MGFFSNLMSRTGPGKLMAAENALVAKFMYVNLSDEHKVILDATIQNLLMSGWKVPAEEAEKYKNKLSEDRYYGMAALAFYNLGINPALKNIMFKDQWNCISNPLVALTGAEREIEMVKSDIQRKHRILVDLTDDIAFKSLVLNKTTKAATLPDTEILSILDKTTETIFVNILKMFNHFKIKRNVVEGGIFLTFLVSNSFYQACIFVKKPKKYIDETLETYSKSIALELFNLRYPENRTSSLPYNSPLYLELDDLIRIRHNEYLQLLPDLVLYENRTFYGICCIFCKNIGEENYLDFKMELSMYLQNSILELTKFFIEKEINKINF